MASLKEGAEQQGDEQEKDQDNDPKPENNVNLELDREKKLLQNQIAETKKSQIERDGDFLAFTNYQVNSNQQ